LSTQIRAAGVAAEAAPRAAGPVGKLRRSSSLSGEKVGQKSGSKNVPRGKSSGYQSNIPRKSQSKSSRSEKPRRMTAGAAQSATQSRAQQSGGRGRRTRSRY
ncbi:hypothetical protein ANCCAN_29057, partial [Ancylostoma caninum]